MHRETLKKTHSHTGKIRHRFAPRLPKSQRIPHKNKSRSLTHRNGRNKSILPFGEKKMRRPDFRDVRLVTKSGAVVNSGSLCAYVCNSRNENRPVQNNGTWQFWRHFSSARTRPNRRERDECHRGKHRRLVVHYDTSHGRATRSPAIPTGYGISFKGKISTFCE